MATFIKILSPSNKKLFDTPPVFTGDQRKQTFLISKRILKIIETFASATNRIGFVLQLGYFRAVNKFYISKKFHNRDIEYVARSLRIDLSSINITGYRYTTSERHQQIILSETGFKKFDTDARSQLTSEAELLTARQQRPRLIFMSLVDFLQSKKIQVPNYNTLAC